MDVLKVLLPQFKDIQKQVAQIELSHVSKVHSIVVDAKICQVYLFLEQLSFETQYHNVFKGAWGKKLQAAINEVEEEVNQICVICAGETDWQSVKDKLDKRKIRREKNLLENPEKALVLKKTKIAKGKSLQELISAISEPVLMRKITNIVRQMYERFIKRNIFAPVTTNSLGKFVLDLEKVFNSVISSLG